MSNGPSRYSWDAHDYARHSGQQQIWARELIARLGLRGDESILDIGCGDGKVTAEIAARAADGAVVGVDNAVAMIALARQRYPQSSHANLRFGLADARCLPFCDAFDVVFSNATLHWLVDHRPALQSIARSLKPGGRAVLQMGGRGNGAAIIALLDRMTVQTEWARYFAGFSFPYGFHGPQEYAPWLRDAGLTARRSALIAKDMVHQGRAGLAGWIRTTWLPWTQRVPDAERDLFVAALVDGYLGAYPLDAQGQAHVAMMRLEVEAQKPGVG